MQRILVTLGVFGAALLCPLGAAAADPACNIVQSVDAGKALGAPVSTITTRSEAGHTACSYRASVGFKRIVVTIMPFKSPAEARTTFHAMVTDSRTYVAPSVNLAGIGDEAHRLGPSIYVRKNDTIYVFTQIAPDPTGAAGLRTVALAKTSIGRLH